MRMLQSCRLKTPLCLGCYFTVILLSAHIAGAERNTNAVPLPPGLISPHTAWGEETNGVRAGVDWELSGGMNVQVVLLTFKTNAAWHYVAPPGKKFLIFELRDARGVRLAPLKGKKLDGELPQRILTKDLPYRPASGAHHRSTIDNRVLIAAGSPWAFRDIVIQDVYRIEQEGDYTLTVCVAIYQFTPDEQSVSRMDLPPITAKLRLRKSIPPEGTASRLVTTYAIGIALCVAGVVWLVAERRRYNKGQAGQRTANAMPANPANSLFAKHSVHEPPPFRRQYPGLTT